MRHLPADSRPGDGGDRIAPADDGRPRRVGDGPGDGQRPVAERVHLEHPQRSVPDHGPGGTDDLRVDPPRPGADVHAQPSADRRVADGQGFVVRARLEAGGDDVVDGQLQPHAPLCRAAFDGACRVDQIRLDERPAHRQPARPEERIGHGAADEQRIDPRQQVLDDLQLAGHLRAAEQRRERPRGRGEQRPEVLQFPLQEQPRGRVGDVRHDARRRGVGAVGRAERVVDVDVRRRHQRRREVRVVRFFLRVEAEVLEQGHAARPGLRDRPLRRLSHAVRGAAHGAAEQLRQPRRDRPQAELRPWPSPRPAEVRGEHERCAPLQGVPQRRQRRPHAGVVGHRAVGQRHVEVDAHQHAPAGEVEVADGALGHGAPPTPSSRRSAAPDRRSGTNSPTRCRTTTAP